MRIHVVDAFTDRPFAGNPAGVCLPDNSRADDAEWMQLVAAEMMHSETAFLAPCPGDEADWGLRWFTTTTEMDLCGHATLASAHVLFTTGQAKGVVRFATRSGILTAEQVRGGIRLDFPARTSGPAEVPDNLTAILGAEPVAVVRAGDDLLVELATVTAVRTLTPDIDALHELPFRGVIITAEAGGEIDGRHIDFVSRFFGCRIGAGEDPVTGSAHCGLAPYWAPRTGKTRMTGAQLSARGGIVDVELTGDRVLLTGPAVSVLEGELTV